MLACKVERFQTVARLDRLVAVRIQKIVEETDDAAFSRAHFANFGTYSLNFEVVYFALSSDYDRYMDINQRINLGIKDGFEKLGVSFALPMSMVQVVNPQPNA